MPSGSGSSFLVLVATLLAVAAEPAAAAESACPLEPLEYFDVDLNGTQCYGLEEVFGIPDAAACSAACCGDPVCNVWQWCPPGAACAPAGSCWRVTKPFDATTCAGNRRPPGSENSGWHSRGRFDVPEVSGSQAPLSAAQWLGLALDKMGKHMAPGHLDQMVTRTLQLSDEAERFELLKLPKVLEIVQNRVQSRAPNGAAGGRPDEDEGGLAEPDDSAVVVLSARTFAAQVQRSEPTLIEFYAPWCGHCKRLAPEVTAAANVLAEDGIVLAKMDATLNRNRAIAQLYEVSGYPTLLVFWANGTKIKFDGDRTKEGIVDYMRAAKAGRPLPKAKGTKSKPGRVGPPLLEPPESKVVVLDHTNFSVVDTWDLALVEFYAPWCGHCKRLAPAFTAASKALDGRVTLAKMDANEVDNKPVAAKHGVRGFPTLLVFQNGQATKYAGGRDEAAIVQVMTGLWEKSGAAEAAPVEAGAADEL